MERFENREGENKKALWEDTMQRLESVKDALGKPIDEGIKETVAAFIINGFPTSGSCEGHVEKRFGRMVKLRPTVFVGTRPIGPRYVGEREIRELIAKQFGISPSKIEDDEKAEAAYWDYIDEHKVPETAECIEIRTKNKEIRKLVDLVLKEFYEVHQAPEDVGLIARGLGPYGLYVISSPQENVRNVQATDIEKYSQQLLAEQAEMKAFTEFLKDRFFNA